MKLSVCGRGRCEGFKNTTLNSRLVDVTSLTCSLDAFRSLTVYRSLSRARGEEQMDFLRHRLLENLRAYAISFDRDIPHESNSEPHGFHTSWMRTRSFSMHQYPYSTRSLKRTHISIVWKIVLGRGLRSANQRSSRRSFLLQLMSFLVLNTLTMERWSVYRCH
jgi:hypothetical protein